VLVVALVRVDVLEEDAVADWDLECARVGEGESDRVYGWD
jgi:hypothetical protein